MPKGKKRLTQREKAERAAIKKQLQADGVLPPDKPRLNRKKFAREVWEDFSEMDVYTADFYLRKAIMATVGPELHEVTSEQVGKLTVIDRFGNPDANYPALPGIKSKKQFKAGAVVAVALPYGDLTPAIIGEVEL